MKAIRHDITHHYQPTDRSCGYTALAILLSHYGINRKPLDIAEAVAPDGHEFGSITAEVATWCRTLDLRVSFYSFDFQITDFSWAKLPPEETVARLRAVKNKRNIPSLGKKMSTRYVQAYIDLLASGVSMQILPHPTTKLLHKLLAGGPVYANVCPQVLYNDGRSRTAGLRKTVPDDVYGKVSTHSLVIYGNDAEGNFLLADPWRGLQISTPETLLCAMTAAEIECDSQLLQVFRD